MEHLCELFLFTFPPEKRLCHSYHTPICTWNGIVINGIEAYELFRKHSIPFRIKRLHFSSKEDVISWICTDQLKREDLTNINKKYLIGKKYDAEKILVSRQLSSTNKSHISGASIAAKKISEECNVAMATVYKYSAYSSALDIIDEKVPDLVKRVRSGQLWISQANIIELSELPKEQLLSLNNYLLAEKIEHLSYHDMKRELLWNNYAKPMLRKESSVSIPSFTIFHTNGLISHRAHFPVHHADVPLPCIWHTILAYI